MKFDLTDRINGIINYPNNLDSVEDGGEVKRESDDFLNRIVNFNIFGEWDDTIQTIFREGEMFEYPSPENVSKNGENVLLVPKTSIAQTKVWETSDKVMPLEGYFIGYQGDKKRVNFASLLNTPEFGIQMFDDLVNGALDTVSTSFYYFLHSLPLNPPVPIKFTDKKVQTEEKFEPNPALLFKNNAGVYSIPDPYIWWLGGIWNYRNYKGSTIDQPKYIDFDGNNTVGWSDVTFTIDPQKKDTNLFYPVNTFAGVGRDFKPYLDTESDDKITLAVDLKKFIRPKDVSEADTVSVTDNTYFAIDSLNGIGNYQDLFNLYHYEFYGANLPEGQGSQMLNWNIDDKLRTFPTYSYNYAKTSSDFPYLSKISLYATYSIFNFSGLPEYGDGSYLKKIDSSTNFSDYKVAYDFYASIWGYMYFYLSDKNSPVTYNEVANNVAQYYSATASFLETEISKIEKLLFDLTVNPTNPNSIRVTTSYNFTEPTVAENDLFTQSGSFRFFIDIVGLHVLKFIEFQGANNTVDLAKYGVKDNSFTCILYPSAGGVAGLQYILSSLPELTAASLNAYISENREQNDIFTTTIINLILNSSRYVWGSGPFVGDTIIKTSDVTDKGDFSVIGNQSKTFLGDLDRFFLTDNSIHTKQVNRPYFLDSDRRSEREETILRYDDVIDYIGCGALDAFESEFLQLTLGSGRAKEILLSLLVVDKSDFQSITFEEQTYSIEDQIKLLTLYNIWLTKGFTFNYMAKDGKTILNLCKVMNASLTQAQTNKISRLVSELTSQRSLFNVGSVFDYGAVKDKGLTVENHFSRVKSTFDAIVFNAVDDDNFFIQWSLFGLQELDEYSSYGFGDTDVKDLYRKYYYRVGNYGSPEQVAEWADYFFKTINVNPTEATIKIAKDFVMLYLKQINLITTQETAFAQTAAIIRGWYYNADRHINAALASVSNYLVTGEKAIMDAQIKEHQEGVKTDINVMKLNTYYNVKSLFDNWIRVQSDGTLGLTYNFSNINLRNTIPETPELLINHFLFVDRANRDVGHNMLVNIEWLKTIYENNDGYNNINTNISLYTFLSDLAKEHSSLIHALPSFIDFGIYTDGKGVDYAGDLFGTFDYVDIIESNPKFLFQFIGNTNTVLNTAQNKYLRSASKSFSLMHSKGNSNKSNISSNIGNGVNIPKDLMQTGATAMAFVVDFGEQHQQIFSNLQVDQSEYQNTEEYFKTLNTYVQGHSQSQGGNLFGLFTERSYTAQVDSLGNLMIQPLMFFELTNVPLFYGTYWITNVKHSITPNDIKTTFKGVRQPMSVLPSKRDVLLQLGTLNISSLLGDDALSDIGGDGSGATGAASSGNVTDTDQKLSSAELAANRLEVKLFLQDNLVNVNKLSNENAKIITAAVMGNMVWESSFNNKAYASDPTSTNKNAVSKGLIQWNSGSYNLSEIGDSVADQMVYLTTKTPNYTKFYNAAIDLLVEREGNDNFIYGTSTDKVLAVTKLFAQKVERCANCVVKDSVDRYETATDNNGKTESQKRGGSALGFYGKFNMSNDELSWNTHICQI